MFGKKKAPGIPVTHYEGLDFPQDFPCRIELAADNLTVTRIKPDQTVTLPISRIKAFSAMEEPAFMLKYHGEAATTTKAKGIQKYYLVVDYTSKNGENKRLAFWGTASEYKQFMELQFMNLGGSSTIEL